MDCFETYTLSWTLFLFISAGVDLELLDPGDGLRRPSRGVLSELKRVLVYQLEQNHLTILP
jgi:hypothetical protein